MEGLVLFTLIYIASVTNCLYTLETLGAKQKEAILGNSGRKTHLTGGPGACLYWGGGFCWWPVASWAPDPCIEGGIG